MDMQLDQRYDDEENCDYFCRLILCFSTMMLIISRTPSDSYIPNILKIRFCK
jgi:hypothetical protein